MDDDKTLSIFVFPLKFTRYHHLGGVDIPGNFWSKRPIEECGRKMVVF